MSTPVSMFDELRSQYETARTAAKPRDDVEGFEAINKRMRHAYAWLDKAFAYLDGVKPPIAHRFDLGHGLVFEAPDSDAVSSVSTSGASSAIRCWTNSTCTTRSPRRSR